jgi:predicted RNase H-like HicB family nuclease
MNFTEIIFEVREDDVDGGYNARALGHDIFTQADSLDELREMVRDAVACHFEGREDRPRVIRLHFVRDEVLAA